MTTDTATAPLSPLLAGKDRGVIDRFGDRALYVITLLAALLSVAVVLGIAYKIIDQASSALSLGFLTTSNFDPVHQEFGAAQYLYGTAVSSFGALLLATPISIAIALFLTELAPRSSRTAIGTLVELLAGIPSVILGLWGIIVLGPALNDTIEPVLHSMLGWIPLFGGTYGLVGMFPAILILTIMTVPIVSSLTREIFATVPPTDKEGALALGATRWEMIKTVVLPYSRPGIIGAVILGLGRALGETMAVTMLIGNRHDIGLSVLQPAYTMAAAIANEFSEATTDLYLSALFEVGLILFVVTVAVNALARLLIWQVARGTAVGSRAL
jgi:phosphate transport system permease protein